MQQLYIAKSKAFICALCAFNAGSFHGLLQNLKCFNIQENTQGGILGYSRLSLSLI